MSGNLIIYMHVLSPFSAYVVAVANHLKIQHTQVQIDLAKNEHKAEWYLKINPKGQIPAIKDGDYCLADSIAISKYLIKSRKIITPLYPTNELDKCEEIDQLLEISKEIEPKTLDALMRLFWDPKLRGKQAMPEDEQEDLRNGLYDTYQKLEDHLENTGTKYFCSESKESQT